jgi:fumarate reductase subunit C
MNVRLYIWQRLTAAIMLPLALAHIGVIFYATRSGLSAAEILGRTRGSFAWAAFYGLFVAAVAVHVPIGLRTALIEWTPLRARHCNIAAVTFGMLLAVTGLRAIAAVVLP